MHLEEEQFQLPLSVKKSRPPRRWALVKGERSEHSLSERVAGIDQVLSTRDIERITGRHRCTVYRWCVPAHFRQSGPAVDEAGFARTSSAGSAVAPRTKGNRQVGRYAVMTDPVTPPPPALSARASDRD